MSFQMSVKAMQLGIAIKTALGIPTLSIRVLVFELGSTSKSRFLIMYTLGGSR